MTLAFATLALLASFPFVLWPLIRHLEPPAEASPDLKALTEQALREVEEVELDVATGRLPPEAGRRRLSAARARVEEALGHNHERATDSTAGPP